MKAVIFVDMVPTMQIQIRSLMVQLTRQRAPADSSLWPHNIFITKLNMKQDLTSDLHCGGRLRTMWRPFTILHIGGKWSTTQSSCCTCILYVIFLKLRGIKAMYEKITWTIPVVFIREQTYIPLCTLHTSWDTTHIGHYSKTVLLLPSSRRILFESSSSFYGFRSSSRNRRPGTMAKFSTIHTFIQYHKQATQEHFTTCQRK